MITKNRAPKYSAASEVTGQRINAFLKKNSLSCRAAALRCGIPTTTMRRYCLGELRPSVSAMEKLAEIGLTEEYVYGRRATAELASSVANDKFIRRFLAQPASVQAEIRDLFEVLFV